MQRAESPAPSLQSQDGSTDAKRTGQKTAYRLFPSVESTPPASPAYFQRTSLHQAAAELRKQRSTSLDPARERWALLSRNNGARPRTPSQTFGACARKASIAPEMNPIQEHSALDSPIVPSRQTYPPAKASKGDASGHDRSAQRPPGSAMTSTWQSRVAASSTQTLNGLGLLSPPSIAPQEDSQAAVKRPRSKPNLRVDIRKSNQSDAAPPPPPKSPRRGRKASDASQASVESASSLKTTHTCAPMSTAQSMAYQPARPTFIHTTSSSRSSSTVPAVPALPFRTAEQHVEEMLRISDAESGPALKNMFLRKAVGQSRPGNPSNPGTPSSPRESGMPLVASKVSGNIMSSRGDLSAEGEKTPKAAQSLLMQPSQAIQTQTSDTKERQLYARSPTIEEAYAHTPRKDSFMQRNQDESVESQLLKPGKNFDDSQRPPTPSKDAHFLPMTQRLPGNCRSAVATAPCSPSLDAPKQPASPLATRQPTCAALRSRPSEPALRTLAMDKGPTPDLPVRTTIPGPGGALADPSSELSNLTKQTEALHKRYATLRSDRQMVQASIVTSLKEQKAGPEYANTMLDQHLELTAINSSMDICFAKMKSLECKKEAAMTAIIAQHKAQCQANAMHRKRESDRLRSTGELKSDTPGRRTPHVNSGYRSNTQQWPLKELKTASPLTRPDRADSAALPACEDLDSNKAKRNTVIRTSGPLTDANSAAEDFTAAPEHIWQAAKDADNEPTKIRLKGAIAAELLGMVREAADSQPGLKKVTLPDQIDTLRATTKQRLLIEVNVPTSPLKVRPPVLPMLPAEKTLPTPPPSAKYQDLRNAHHQSIPSDDSTTSTVSSARSSDATEPSIDTTSRPSSTSHSSLEQHDAETPPELTSEVTDEFESKSQLRKAGKPTRGKSVQTIQVYVDEEILEDYEQNILDYYGTVSPDRTKRRHR